MKFWVVTLTATLLALTGRMSWAIGLGDIATQSFVNGPLNATIEVLQPSGLSEVEVIPSLASIDDFDRLGLDRHYSLSRLLFEPDFSGFFAACYPYWRSDRCRSVTPEP